MSEAKNLGELLGVEGNGAAIYFGSFGAMLRERQLRLAASCRVSNSRTATDGRRPIRLTRCCRSPTLCWSRELTATLSAVGFDPYRGFYHQPRYGRPALALDIMEPFRPILANSAVITAINNGEVNPGDFIRAGRACALSPSGRKKMIAAFERRLAQEITHPVFGYRLSYRRLLEVQARLLGRHLMGEIPEFPAVEPR